MTNVDLAILVVSIILITPFALKLALCIILPFMLWLRGHVRSWVLSDRDEPFIQILSSTAKSTTDNGIVVLKKNTAIYFARIEVFEYETEERILPD